MTGIFKPITAFPPRSSYQHPANRPAQYCWGSLAKLSGRSTPAPKTAVSLLRARSTHLLSRMGIVYFRAERALANVSWPERTTSTAKSASRRARRISRIVPSLSASAIYPSNAGSKSVRQAIGEGTECSHKS